MPDSVFQLNNGSQSVNLGAYGKPINWKRIKAMILTPLSFFLTNADVASAKALKDKLQAAALHADPAQRIQIMETIQEAESSGAEPITQSFGYGLSKTIYSGQYGMRFFFGDSDLAKHQLRQQFNGLAEQYLVLLVDESLQIIGTKGDNDGETVITGFTMADFLADNVAMDAGEGAKQSVNVSFLDSAELNKGNLMVWPAGFNVLKNVKNVGNAELTAMSDLATRVVSIAPMAGNKNLGTNLAAMYPTILAGATTALTLWKARDRATGLPLTVSTAAKAVLNGVDVVTLTFAVTNFPTAPGAIDIYWDTPENLATAGVKYFEAQVLTLEVA